MTSTPNKAVTLAAKFKQHFSAQFDRDEDAFIIQISEFEDWAKAINAIPDVDYSDPVRHRGKDVMLQYVRVTVNRGAKHQFPRFEIVPAVRRETYQVRLDYNIPEINVERILRALLYHNPLWLKFMESDEVREYSPDRYETFHRKKEELQTIIAEFKIEIEGCRLKMQEAVNAARRELAQER